MGPVSTKSQLWHKVAIWKLLALWEVVKTGVMFLRPNLNAESARSTFGVYSAD